MSSAKELAVYAKLVKELVRRYFCAKAEASLKETATTDQVTNLREIVSGLKDKYKSLSLGAYTRDRRAKPDLPGPQGLTPGRPGESEGSRTRVEQVNEIIDSAAWKIATPLAPPPPPPTPDRRTKLDSRRRDLDNGTRETKSQPTVSASKSVMPPTPPPMPPTADRRTKLHSRRRDVDVSTREAKSQVTASASKSVIPSTPPPMLPTPDRRSKPDVRKQESRTRIEQVNERTGSKSASPPAPPPPPPQPPRGPNK